MNYRIIILILFVFIFLFGCDKDNPTIPEYQANITKISPNSAKVDEEITITGLNFGIAQGSSIVFFNSLQATGIISWEEKEIKLIVPKGAKSGKVSVTVNTIKSNEVDFTVLEPDPMESVIIGSQTWMLKNLDVEFYRNGDSIRHAESIEDWIDAGEKEEGAWCYYNNDPAMGAVYGKLYNWHAVNDNRGLAPYGWHVSNLENWDLLIQEIGEEWLAGGKLKESGTEHWEIPNEGGNNSSGFTALPGGNRSMQGIFGRIKRAGFWWISDGYWNHGTMQVIYLGYYDIKIMHPIENVIMGLSVRCVKD